METTNTEQIVRQRQEASLQELNGQLLRSEIQDVADKSGVVRNTVIAYLEGSAPKSDTARKIIKAARAIILARENDMAA